MPELPLFPPVVKTIGKVLTFVAFIILLLQNTILREFPWVEKIHLTYGIESLFVLALTLWAISGTEEDRPFKVKASYAMVMFGAMLALIRPVFDLIFRDERPPYSGAQILIIILAGMIILSAHWRNQARVRDQIIKGRQKG